MSTSLTRNELTPEIINAIAQIISRGNYYVTACKALKIPPATFYRWMDIGRAADSGIYHDLVKLVEQADAASEMFAVEEWRNHFSKDYRAERDFLARRHPDRWAERKHITIAVEREIEHMLRELQRRLPSDIFEILVNEISEIGRTKELEVEEVTDAS